MKELYQFNIREAFLKKKNIWVLGEVWTFQGPGVCVCGIWTSGSYPPLRAKLQGTLSLVKKNILNCLQPI